MRIDDELYRLAAAVGHRAKDSAVRIIAVESCTGGLVAAALTAVAGSSDWFDRGFVTYSNESKVDLVAVPADTLARFGAVSEETALAMAHGALRGSGASWSVAVTGIAGPGGGTPAKPVGTVCFAWVGPGTARTLRTRVDGDRAEVRRESVRIALEGLLKHLAEGANYPVSNDRSMP